MKTIIIPTTQNIELEYQIANPGDRMLAGIIDFLIVITYGWLWMKYVSSVGLFEADSWTEYINAQQSIFWLGLMPAGAYSLLCEVFMNGRTVGKLLLNTRTVRLDGHPPTLSDYLIRWVLRIADVWIFPYVPIPGLIGMSTIMATPNHQRLGDLAAGTAVIKQKLITTFGDTIFVETSDQYQVQFPEIQRLSDRDVSILKEVLDAGMKQANPHLLERLADKVKTVTGISSDLPAQSFLETVLQDYNHIFGRKVR